MGALGPVFRTYEPTHDRLVAVKVFRLDITPEQAQSLADELALAAKSGLVHPSVVEPIAAGVQGSVAYRAEEYVAAESLDVAMRHYAPAAIEKVLPFISQLAAAVDFARMNGVGHGALHPRDIFVTPEEARATGFGVVEALERVGLRAPVRRPYSAPERVAGGKWGTPADVFSLAAIAYELLTGRRPAGVGAAIGDLSGSSLGERAPLVHAVLVRAMEENPSARFPTAMALAAALEAATRGQVMAATAPPRAASVAPPVAAASVPPAVAAAPTPPQPEPEPTAEPDFEIDDIAAEREEDAAFFDLARDEVGRDIGPETAPGHDLFDIEAVEDLALEPEPQRFKDEFDPVVLEETTRRPRSSSEPAMRAQPGGLFHAEDDDDAYVPPPRRALDYVPEETHAEEPRRRHRFLPLALMLMLGVVVGVGIGLAMGYGIWGVTTPMTKDEQAEAQTKPDEPAEPKPPSAAKPYSEGTVTPPQEKPSQPPPIPADAPPPAGTPAAAPSNPASGATPAPASSGRLIVRSSPPNAGVTLNGTWRGRTPLTLEKLRLGTHEVRVVQPGFTVATQSISLTATAPARTLSFRLQQADAPVAAPQRPALPPPGPARPPQEPTPPSTPEPRGPGSLFVDSRPRGASVFLDGRKVGVTPATIPDVTPGPHVVRLELPDHRPWTANSQVLAGQQTRVTGSLERVR